MLNHIQLRPRHAAGLRHLVRVYRRSGDIARAAAGEATLAARVRDPSSGPSEAGLAAHRRDIAVRREARHAARAGRRREAPPPAAAGDFLVVSGLPRSGTSLMMQILYAGGIKVMTDGAGSPDSHNPEGYFEWEPIKSLRQHPRAIEQTAGKAVKVVAPLLPFLPAAHRYRIIYMIRPIEQVVASQCRMLGDSAPSTEQHAELARRQESQQRLLLEKLSDNKSCDLLEISYPDLVSTPALTVARVADFLGVSDPALRTRMCEAVRPDLHRNRHP